MLLSTFVFAQDSPDLASPARNFLTNTLRPLYPIAISGIALIGGIMNIGKVMGTDSDWKGFFTKIGLFLLAAIILVVVIEFLYSLVLNF
tara:strand:+ start:1339 stop:1605 length:267 start_codon:yes stop_codon:yes gene_type:complete